MLDTSCLFHDDKPHYIEPSIPGDTMLDIFIGRYCKNFHRGFSGL